MQTLDQALRFVYLTKQMLMPYGLALASCCLYGCDQANSEQSTPQSPLQAVQHSNMHKLDTALQSAKPMQLPTPAQVLYAIYQYAADANSSFSMHNGAVVNYWYGYQFELQGKHYFTGFANSTAAHYAYDQLQARGDVLISQATFVPSHSDDNSTWTVIDSNGYIGEFGRMDKPYNIDTEREARSYSTADGKLLLAVPIHNFAKGIHIARYALFFFDPESKQRSSNGLWKYVGSVFSGSDNRQACADGAGIPSVYSSAKISFEQNARSSLPNIKVYFTGTDLSHDNQVRNLGASDAVRYTYDAKQTQYRPE